MAEREESVLRLRVQDEEEKREIRELLALCAGDFVPPLTQRSSTTQQSWEQGSGDGVALYAEALLQQSVLLWKQDGKTVGLLSFRPEYVCEALPGQPTVFYLSTLCVSPACRGQGLARRIYEAVLAFARETLPERPVVLRTWSTNAPQLRLMTRLGFAEIFRLPDDRGPGVDTVYYRLAPR